MGKILVVVESPAKATTLSKFLGAQYVVKSSLGHVRDLPKKQLGVDVEHDFEPTYVVVQARRKTVSALKKTAAEARATYLAMDPDREGEAISWHLAELLGKVNGVKRVSFEEVTKSAVVEAMKSPREIDRNLVLAQQARRVLDRLVGYKLSPLLWKKVRRGLSAGRVQSVALRLICEREDEIEAFRQQEYWSISVKLESRRPEAAGAFTARLEKVDGKKPEILNQASAGVLASELEKQDYFITGITVKPERRHPGPPFTTSLLQQHAVRRLRYTTARTMRLAQQLYEGIDVGEDGPVGLITYMRTDSFRVSAEAQKQTLSFIRERYGAGAVPEKPNFYRSRKGAQEAHEAIRPTDVRREPQKMKAFLSEEQYRLYELIWKRFVASQMASAELEVTRVEISAGRFQLVARGSRVVKEGFFAVEPPEVWHPKAEQKVENAASAAGEDETVEEILPPLQEGEPLSLLSVEPKQHFTKPPPRYTEGTLVRALEEKGIGRPSTYAYIIRTIQDRNYVNKERGRFEPTRIGRLVIQRLVQFFPEVLDVQFTAGMEEKLDEVEGGRAEWVAILRGFYDTFSENLDEAASKWEKENTDEPTSEVCDLCGRPMVLKWGRFGQFLACSGFPECKNAKPIVRKTGVKCPREGCPGFIIERRTKRRRIFYGCDQYPKCDFSLWTRPVAQPCPVCGAAFLVEKRRAGAGQVLSCATSGCPYGVKADGEAEEPGGPASEN